jgi:hypothetical protein
MVSDRTRPRSQRAEKAVHHRRELTRGFHHIERDSDDQGIVLDERHQEQPADKGRANARQDSGLSRGGSSGGKE